MKGFLKFVQEQGVMGLAVGFLLGGAVSRLVGSLVTDIISPLLGLVLGAAGNLNEAFIWIGPAKLKWGSFLSSLIDFLVIALVVYVGVALFRLTKKVKGEK